MNPKKMNDPTRTITICLKNFEISFVGVKELVFLELGSSRLFEISFVGVKGLVFLELGS